MTPRSWEHWVDRYTKRGYRVIAPAWPGLEGEVEQIRRDPSPLDDLGVTEIVEDWAIERVGEPKPVSITT